MKLRFFGISFKALFLLLTLLFGANSTAADTHAAASAGAGKEQTKGELLFNAGDTARGVVACAGCHGSNGNSMVPENPKLAGQGASYLAKQLHDFKAGKRVNPVMAVMAAPLSNQDITNLAAYLSTQKTADSSSQDIKLATQGKQIFRGGVASKNIPACAACHAANGAGIPAQYPRLAGQNIAYTQAQLTAFRSGTRVNAQMNSIAALLSDKEINALADYLAGVK